MDRSELEGTLHTMSIAEVLQWAEVAKKTGALRVSIEGGGKTVHFEEGRVIYATSTQKSEKIGSFLIRSRKLDKEKIARLRDLHRSTKKSFDGLALEEGMLTAEQVRQAVDSLVEVVFQMLLVESEGSFKFLDRVDLPRGAVPTSIRIEDLLARGLRIRQEWEEIEPHLPIRDSHLRTTDKVTDDFVKGLRKRESKLLELIDGSRTVLDLRCQSPLPEFETCRCLAGWAKEQLIEDPSPAQAELRNLAREILAIAEQIDRGEVIESLARLESILGKRPGYPMAVYQRDRARKILDREVAKTITSLDMIPRRVPDLRSRMGEGLRLDAREGYALSRVDDRSNLKQIAQLCGLSDRQVKRIMYKLQQFKLVRFQDSGEEGKKVPSRETEPRSGSMVTVPEERMGAEESGVDGTPTSMQYTLTELNKLYSDYTRMNHYEKLGVSRSASKEQIREAYGRLSMLYHPDRYFQERDRLDPKLVERLEELFVMVYDAYQTLSSARGRGMYDKQLAQKKERLDLGQDRMYEDFIKAFSQPVTERAEAEKPEKSRPEEPKKARKEEQEEKEPELLEPTGLEPPPSFQDEELPKDSAPAGRTRSRDRREIARQHFEVAQKLFENKRYRDVVQEMTEAVRRDARQHEYYALLAEAQLALGKNLQQAVDNTKRAIMLQKEHSPYYALLSRVYRSMEDLPSAERYMKIAVAWDPYNKEMSTELKEIREQRNSSIFKRLFRKRKSK